MTAAELARAVLPHPDDLPGEGWELDVDDDGDEIGPDGGGSPFAPGEVPAGFPIEAVVADDDATFVRAGPTLAHAVAAVLADRPAAARAWDALAHPAFVEHFLADLAGDETGEGEREVLGPVTSPAGFAVDRAGWRACTHHGAWSVTDEEGVLPVTVDMAVLLAGPVVVLVWLAGPAGPELEQGWDHLLGRLELRCEAALAGEA